MPQIAQLAATYSSQIFWALIVFGLIYFVVGQGMVPRVAATIDARDQRIADDLAAAQHARMEADTTEDSWRTRMAATRAEAQAAIARAKAEGAVATERQVKATDAELAARTAEAEGSIRAAQTSALASIEDVAVDATRDLVAKLSGLDIPPDAAARAVREAMTHG